MSAAQPQKVLGTCRTRQHGGSFIGAAAMVWCQQKRRARLHAVISTSAQFCQIWFVCSQSCAAQQAPSAPRHPCEGQAEMHTHPAPAEHIGPGLQRGRQLHLVHDIRPNHQLVRRTGVVVGLVPKRSHAAACRPSAAPQPAGEQPAHAWARLGELELRVARLTAARQTVPAANGNAVLVPDPLLAGTVVARGFAFGSEHPRVRAAGGGVGGRAVGAQVRAGVATGRDRDPSLCGQEQPGSQSRGALRKRVLSLTHCEPLGVVPSETVTRGIAIRV